jgi:hypothetical protein
LIVDIPTMNSCIQNLPGGFQGRDSRNSRRPARVGDEIELATSVPRMAARVRELISASAAIHRILHSCDCTDPASRGASVLCDAALLEVQSLTASVDVPGAPHEGCARLAELLGDAKRLAEAFDKGAFDDPVRGPARLMAHARRLGPHYAAMLMCAAVV